MLTQLIANLTGKIKDAYESSVTVEEAEKLAAEFLHAQLQVAAELEKLDLDSRMRKNGVKAVRAAIYLDECGKTDKKPSDTFLQAKVDSNELSVNEQTGYDEAESKRSSMQNYFGIFKDAHIYFRGIAKGSFNG